jgi:hypothetical protein
MNPQKILGDMDLGIQRTDVTVFRYRKNRALLIAILTTLTGVAVLAAAAALAPSLRPDAGSVKYGATAFVGLVALSAFWLAWRKSREILAADTNLLVVAPEGVVRRLCGRVHSWSFAEFPDITFVVGDRHNSQHALRIVLGSHNVEDSMVRANASSGTISAIYLNESGASFQHALVDDGTFGPMHEILAAIASRGMGRS